MRTAWSLCFDPFFTFTLSRFVVFFDRKRRKARTGPGTLDSRLCVYLDMCLLHYGLVCFATDHRRSRHGYSAVRSNGAMLYIHIPSHTSQEDEPTKVEYYCEPCRKSFKSEKAGLLFVLQLTLQTLSTISASFNGNVRKRTRKRLSISMPRAKSTCRRGSLSSVRALPDS